MESIEPCKQPSSKVALTIKQFLGEMKKAAIFNLSYPVTLKYLEKIGLRIAMYKLI